tara:strand:- start:681 stop:1172 length:492 start_codon:yes stop_codon:yes gene_type:complete
MVNLTIWVESDLDVAPLILRVDLVRESLNQEDPDEKSGELAGVIVNGLSIVALAAILGGLLFVLWREFSKEDEEDSYNYDSGITSYVGEDGRSVPSASMLLGVEESNQQSKIVPELPPEPVVIQTQDAPEVSNGPPLPESGLPEGWTMQQWQHYGQQWIDQQK